MQASLPVQERARGGDGTAGDAGFTSAKFGNGEELGPIGAGETLGAIGGDGFRVEAPGERVGG